MKKAKKSCALLALMMGAALSVTAVSPNYVRGNAEDVSTPLYKTDYNSVTEVLDEIYSLNETVAQEGFVLLKNEQNNLPFANSVKKVSLFGRNSVSPVYSGTGSSGGSSGVQVSIEQSLKNSGFKLNQKLIDFYGKQASRSTSNYASFWFTGETPLKNYTEEVKSSYADYNDAAVVVFSRTGGEGSDAPTASLVRQANEGTTKAQTDGYPTREEVEEGTFTPYGGQGRENTPYDHYLSLDENEMALLDEVTANFDKVVVVLNSVQIMELSDEFMNNDKIQSVIWAPGAGPNGFNALGKILTGEVNPSGRTSDTFMADFKADPTFKNFGNNGVGRYTNDDAGNIYTLEDGSIYKNNFNNNVYEVSYEEGIYLGYKYYETRGFTDGEEWYHEAVNYPFGYGLSYTTFEWEVGDVKLSTSGLNEKSKISVDVKVTNTGDVAGKDVVEAYFSAPYAAGKTEKSHVVLGGFEKTDMLKPGKSQTVTITFDAFDMASFDAYDKDGDGHKGYELDAGAYTLYVGKNAHDAWSGNKGKNIATLTSDINIDKDPTTNADIAPRFQTSTDEMEGRVLSRNDWKGTFPTTPSWYGKNAELVKDEKWLSNFDMPLIEGATAANAVIDPSYDVGKPWYAETAPAFQAADKAYSKENPAPIQLSDMAGIDYNDKKWDEFVSQLTVDQSYAIMQATRFQFEEVPAVGAPLAGHSDGPQGISGPWVGGGRNIIRTLGTSTWGVETLVACTWNKDIAYNQGRLTGEYGLWAKTVGWYAPGGNTHRSPFAGRNFEYYSEDGVLAGYMMSNVVKGARDKGMVTFMKHFALNDQESNRDTNGVATWADEQTMREIYFKPFEWAVKKGDSNGAMSSFNRIGFDWSGANYALLTELSRGEWGFKGVVITDAHQSGYGCMNASQMIRAGNDMSLDSKANSIARIVNSDESNTPTQLQALHNAVKHILYVQLNSAAMAEVDYATTLTYDKTGLESNYVATAGTAYTLTTGRNPKDNRINIKDASDAEHGYTIVSGKLPKGLTLDSEGYISGTIASDAAGIYSVKVAKRYVEGDGLQYIHGMTSNASTYATFTFVVPGFSKATNGSVDTVTLTLEDGKQYSFTMDAITEGLAGENGKDGVDGINGVDGVNGVDGINGTDGRGIKSIVINDNGELIITYTDNTTDNVGKVVGADGKDGADAGCGGVIGSESAIAAVVAVFAVLAASTLVRRKKED